MSSTFYKDSQTLSSGKADNNWPVISVLFLLLAIPGIPAILIVASVLVGFGSNELPLAFIKSIYLPKPWAVIVHGISGVLFFLSAPFQFSPALRSKHLKLHKYSGYLVFISGYIMALSGIWMHHVLSPIDIGPRYIGLVLMAFAMCIAFSIALKHIIQKNIVAHQAWVIRALAITLGAVTYIFVEVAFSLTLGQIEGLKPLIIDFLHNYGRITAIVVNLFIAEYLIKRLAAKKY